VLGFLVPRGDVGVILPRALPVGLLALVRGGGAFDAEVGVEVACCRHRLAPSDAGHVTVPRSCRSPRRRQAGGAPVTAGAFDAASFTLSSAISRSAVTTSLLSESSSG